MFTAEQEKLIQREIERLQGADEAALDALNEDSVLRRTAWFNEHRAEFDFLSGDPLEAGYRLLLARFGITPEQAPVVERTERRIVAAHTVAQRPGQPAELPGVHHVATEEDEAPGSGIREELPLLRGELRAAAAEDDRARAHLLERHRNAGHAAGAAGFRAVGAAEDRERLRSAVLVLRDPGLPRVLRLPPPLRRARRGAVARRERRP